MDIRRSVDEVCADISYRVRMDKDAAQIHRPVQIGTGKFAKVFKAIQLSAGREVREVAIKVLHDNATLVDERLFTEEVQLLHQLMTESGVNIVHTLDIVEVGPLIACGCGQMYWPGCPNGCEVLLERVVHESEQYPSLYCPACKKFELSARVVSEQQKLLFTFPAKRCCRDNATADIGTIINFVDREAIVMELLDKKLSDYLATRREELRQAFAPHRLSLEQPGKRSQRGDPIGARMRTWLGDMWSGDQPAALVGRALLLEKTRLMIQLAESVAWLHGSKKIVHKDLAPDNIMVTGVDTPASAARTSVESLIADIASADRVRLRVIDFGLSDKDELSRRWYEDTVTHTTEKNPFLSPEAMTTQEGISGRIKFSDRNRAIVPGDLDVLVGDIVADLRAPTHQYDLKIVEVGHDSASGGKLIQYTGTPFPESQHQQYAIVRRLGEAHDVYALGALFYFILSEKIMAAQKLSALVQRIRDDPQLKLTPSALAAEHQYRGLRDEIPEQFWQDELLLLILRAMVSGRSESLMLNRATRDAGASEALLAEIRRIHYNIHRELLAARDIVRFRRLLVATVALITAVALSAAIVALLRSRAVVP
jgi:serine/threonine protein kinase